MSVTVRPARLASTATMARRRATVLLVFLALLLGACDRGAATEPDVEPVRVGAWPQAEPRLLSEALAALLRLDGMPAEVVKFEDAADARRALELEDVDVLPGYTGAAWLEVLERADPPGNPATSFARVREFDERQGIHWLRPRFEEGTSDTPPANTTFAFFVMGPPAVDAGLQTLSQLASRLAEDPTARLCMDDEFVRRQDGRLALFRAYGISTQRQDVAASPSEAVAAVGAGECLAGLSTSTSGEAWVAGLRPLRDDLVVFPAFVVAPALTTPANDREGVGAALSPFTAQLSNELLARHNAAVLAGATPERSGADLAGVLRDRAGRGQTPTLEGA